MRTIKRDIAGVFVFSSDNKILLGYTGVYSGKLVVPGGGIHNGETPEQAARREVLEEAGLDLSQIKLEKIPGANSGTSEKVLRETGEKVEVHMTFFDYTAQLDTSADTVDITTTDDLFDAHFFSAEELKDKAISQATKSRLIELGFLTD